MTHWRSQSKLKSDPRRGRSGMPVDRGPAKALGGAAALAGSPWIQPKGSSPATHQNGDPGHEQKFVNGGFLGLRFAKPLQRASTVLYCSPVP